MTPSIPVTLQAKLFVQEDGMQSPFVHCPGVHPKSFPAGPCRSGLCFWDPGCRNLNATRGCSDSKDRTGPQRLKPVGRGDCGPVMVSPNDWPLQWSRPSQAPPPPQGVLPWLSQSQNAAHPADPGPETYKVQGGCWGPT